jgi:hypothetical protein
VRILSWGGRQGWAWRGRPFVAVKDLAAAIQVVTAGRNDMPPFGTAFSLSRFAM